MDGSLVNKGTWCLDEQGYRSHGSNMRQAEPVRPRRMRSRQRCGGTPAYQRVVSLTARVRDDPQGRGTRASTRRCPLLPAIGQGRGASVIESNSSTCCAGVGAESPTFPVCTLDKVAR